MRFRRLTPSLWIGLARRNGRRYSVRLRRLAPDWWHAEHRQNGRPVSASSAASLAVQKHLARTAADLPTGAHP
ncbi:MAG: hypothetical protein RLO11_00110 [Salinisphaeraceae bacterium]